MSEETKSDITGAQSLILALDEARRKEIESVRGRMEEFLKGQLELKHEMELVSKGQDNLKERFEMGVSKTIFELNKKFDSFMIDWGRKLAEDELRDKRLSDVDTKAISAEKKADGANESAAFYGKSILGTLLGGLVLAAIIWVFTIIHR